MPQLALSEVTVEYGGTPLLQDVNLAVEARDRWGIIGRNGSGKTTLFNLLRGLQAPSRGQVIREPGCRLAVLDQYRDFGAATTVWEAAAGPFAELLALEHSLMEQAAALGADPSPAALDRYARDQERFEREGGYTIAPRVDAILHGLGFDPEAARTRPHATLSGGERGRLGLARQLAAPADVLLLDEPTNHLDLETTTWLERYLRDVPATVLLVSHDRAFLQNIVDHVLHLEGGTTVSYTGDYQSFLRQRAERRLTQARAFRRQQAELAAEEDYIRRNIAGGNSAQAKGRRRRLERVSRLSPPPGEEAVMSLRLEPDQRGGDQVLVAEAVTVAIGERVLLQDFSARVERGDVIGLIGPNGEGKTTLLRTLLGELEPREGVVRLGAGTSVAWYRQDLSQVPEDRSLYDAIADQRTQWTRGQIQGHLGRFGFSGDTVLRMGRTLSGGERARMGLALLMLSRANLLVFDEPTNHLDVESIEALEDAIADYAGTVILVSHDRELLRALTSRLWVLHQGRITDYPGGFGDWELVSAEREHAARVAAQEEEQRRRVEERRRTRNTAPARSETSRKRSAARALEQAEAEVARLEAAIAEVTLQLNDPGLYGTVEGTARARELGDRLDELKRELDGAFERWAAASSAADGPDRS